MSMSGINNYQMSGVGVNFQGNSSKPVTETPKSDKKLSTGMKIGLGAAAVATSVIAGIAIKNKASANTLKKAAKEFGFDVETYKNLKSEGFKFSQADNIEYEDIIKKVTELVKNKRIHGDKFFGVRNIKGYSDTCKKMGKNVNLPENTLLFGIQRGDDIIHRECIVCDKMGESLKDFVNAKDVYIRGIKEVVD